MNEKELENTTIKNTIDLPYSNYQPVKYFCILSFFSFGIYSFFWMFKHWQYLRDEKGMNINASHRTFFTLFYGYSLFKEFQLLAIEKGYRRRLPIGLLFIIFLLLWFTVMIKGSLLILFSYTAFLALIPIHRMMNFYYLKQEGYQLRNKLSKGEKWFLSWIWIFLIGSTIAQILN